MIRWLPFVFVPLVAWFKDAAVVVLALGTILMLAQPQMRAAALARPRVTPAVAAFAIFTLWTLITFAWAGTLPVVNWTKAFLAIGLIGLLGRGVEAASDETRQDIARGLLGGVAALFVLLVVERATGGFLLGLQRVGDSADRNYDTLSPGLALLTCLTFPAAYLVWHRHRRLWMAAAVALAVFALGTTYRMDASPFGLILGVLAFVWVWIAGRFGFAVAAGLLAVAALGWGTLASLAWSDDLPSWFTAHFTRNWGLRLEIWHRVDELIHARPLLGYGFDAARTVGEPNAVAVGVSREVNFLHPHNGLLQVWLELGAVGVAIFIAWYALGLRALQQRATDRAALATTLATLLVVAMFWEVSFGIWQGWWLSAVGLTFIALRVAIRSRP